MAGQQYTTQVGRLEKYPGRILAKAQKEEMLCKLGSMDPMPQNKSEKIEWLRFLPYGGVDNQWIAAGGDTAYIAAHLISDGVTPDADTVAWTTVNTTLKQIGCLFSYTDKTAYVHEEGSEIPREMEDQASQRIALCREMMCYGEMKACTNVFYGGTGTSIATVNGPPTKGLLQDVSRAMLGKHAIMINQQLKSGPDFGMQSVAASWQVYCHTDMEKTFENMVGFTKVQDYGGRPLLHPEYEIGAIGRFRIIVNPILTYSPDAGANISGWTGSGTMKSTSGTLGDVYPLIVVGRGKGGGDAFGQVPLRGFQSLMANHKKPSEITKSDMLGQRGYVAAATWQAQKVLNDDWMAVVYVGTED